jgi:hypothetical protein
MADERLNQRGDQEMETIAMPAPTAWPVSLAFGLTLVFAGLLTSGAVSVLGAIVAIAGAVGWFRAVLPQEAHEMVQASLQVPDVTTLRREVARVEIVGELRRAFLPVEIYPVSAGIKGGLAGSVVMAALAMLYGVVSHKSIWYPINLLAAGFFPALQTTTQIMAFDLSALLIAIPIHLITSLLVGLLYGATLPMMPRRPVVLGGFIAPLLWSGLIHSILGIVNPVMDHRIDWIWFVFSQVGFGLTAGIVVSWQGRIRTLQHLPLAFRAGMEASGMKDDLP